MRYMQYIHTSARVRRTAKQRKRKRSFRFMMAGCEKTSKGVSERRAQCPDHHLLSRYTNL